MLILKDLGVRLGVRIYFKIMKKNSLKKMLLNYSIKSKFEKKTPHKRKRGLKVLEFHLSKITNPLIDVIIF